MKRNGPTHAERFEKGAWVAVGLLVAGLLLSVLYLVTVQWIIPNGVLIAKGIGACIGVVLIVYLLGYLFIDFREDLAAWIKYDGGEQ